MTTFFRIPLIPSRGTERNTVYAHENLNPARHCCQLSGFLTLTKKNNYFLWNHISPARYDSILSLFLVLRAKVSKVSKVAMSSPDSSTLSPMHRPQHEQQGNNKYKIVAGYALQQRLGAGSFATVYKGVKVPNTTGQSQNTANDIDTVAIKAITRSSDKLTKKVLENLEMEISILRTYRHPNIVCLHDVQKTERHFYLILEYCSGGDLQHLIRSRKSGRLSERLTRRLVRDLASGMQFLWGQELIHRDIKPQNLLLTGILPLDEINDPCKSESLEEERRQANFPSRTFSLKIADFGFARHLRTSSLAETLCGSPLYMAPEILQHQRYEQMSGVK